MKRFTLLLLFLLAVLAACTPSEATPTAVPDVVEVPPTGGEIVGGWNAVTLEGAEVVQPSVPNIIFAADGTVSGNGSCNGFGGTYVVNGETLTIGELAATEMACEEPGIMEQEQQFFDVLRRVTGFTRAGDILGLTDEAGNVLVTLTAVQG